MVIFTFILLKYTILLDDLQILVIFKKDMLTILMRGHDFINENEISYLRSNHRNNVRNVVLEYRFSSSSTHCGVTE